MAKTMKAMEAMKVMKANMKSSPKNAGASGSGGGVANKASSGICSSGVSDALIAKFNKLDFQGKVTLYREMFEDGSLSAADMSQVLQKVFKHDERCKLWDRLKTQLKKGSAETKETWAKIDGLGAREGKTEAKNQMLALQVAHQSLNDVM